MDVDVEVEGIVKEKARRTRGESSASTERASCAVCARWGDGKGMVRVLVGLLAVILLEGALVWLACKGSMHFEGLVSTYSVHGKSSAFHSVAMSSDLRAQMLV